MGLVTLELKDGTQWDGLLPEEMMILDFRTHWRKLVAHSGEKPFPVIGGHSDVASTVEKNQTNILLGMQFKETFKDPQWRKVKQMQPMRLYLLSQSQASNLTKHLNTHNWGKLNKCNQWDYASFQAVNLKKRLKTHFQKCWVWEWDSVKVWECKSVRV